MTRKYKKSPEFLPGFLNYVNNYLKYAIKDMASVSRTGTFIGLKSKSLYAKLHNVMVIKIGYPILMIGKENFNIALSPKFDVINVAMRVIKSAVI